MKYAANCSAAPGLKHKPCGKMVVMKRNYIFSGMLSAGLFGSLTGFSGNGPQPVRNIVFILADDLGIKDLGSYGSGYYETPNCDRLAAEGMRFTSAYSAHPVCSPTRASILTGRYPQRLHLTTYIPGKECPHAMLCSPDWIKYLRESETTYAEAFREAGYATCHIGKWHVGSWPGKYGFDVVTAERRGDQKDYNDPWFVDCYTTAAEKFMAENKDRPFLLTLSHGTVHVPLYEKDDLIGKYREKTPGENGQNNPVYAAMVERMDWSVGRVLAKIKELGLETNTAVVFFSDNGGLMEVYDEALKKSVVATSNLPYRGGKSQLYEGGIRVPLIIKWPGVTEPGSTCDVPVISTDLYPTFLNMAGLLLRPEQHLDGLSLTPLLRGQNTLPRKNLFWHYPHYHTLPPHSAVRSEDWKLIEFFGEKARMELFDLKNDPGETHNLVSEKPETAQRLRQLLHDHLDSIGAQMATPNPNVDPSVDWGRDSCNGSYDPYERNQSADPRGYVTDPARDYRAN
jgi:arylsulfatase A-like enzyme